MCESFWIFWLWTLFETIPCFFKNYLNIDQIDDTMNYTHYIPKYGLCRYINVATDLMVLVCLTGGAGGFSPSSKLSDMVRVSSHSPLINTPQASMASTAKTSVKIHR